MKDDIQKAFRGYELAKNAGLKVLPTFRITEDEQMALMTYAGTNELEPIKQSRSKDREPNEKALAISNLDDVLNQMEKQVRLATKANIQLGPDIFVYLLGKNDNRLDFVIVDTSDIRANELRIGEKDLYKNNLLTVVISLEGLLMNLLYTGDALKTKKETKTYLKYQAQIRKFVQKHLENNISA